MSRKLLITNGTFAVLEEQEPVVNGYMLVEDDLITYIGSERPEGSENAEVMDGKGLLFLPGLINTHGHAAMSLLRGYGDDMVLQKWLQEKMWPMEAKFTRNDVYWGTALSVLEMIKGERQPSLICMIIWTRSHR